MRTWMPSSTRAPSIDQLSQVAAMRYRRSDRFQGADSTMASAQGTTVMPIQSM